MFTEKLTSENINLRNRSGKKDSDDPLVAFFYLLMRDHLTSGVVRQILGDMRNDQGDISTTFLFTNGFLAEDAKDVVKLIENTRSLVTGLKKR